MKLLKRLKEFYFGMGKIPFAFLALCVEISLVTYLASIILYFCSAGFASPGLVTDIALKTGQGATVIAWGGVVLSALADIIIKYDLGGDTENEK